MTATEHFLKHNEQYADAFTKGDLPRTSAKRVTVITCMDARIDPSRILGFDDGDAHVLRNAGGVVTDDVIRSLVLSQRLQGTEEIVLMHHTDCGMTSFDDAGLQAQIEAETGTRLPFGLEAFADVEADVLRSMARIAASPFVPNKDAMRGFVYEVETGRLREVKAE
jgi:carbonic anhydrase